jgi:hypothetical protein
MGVILKFSDSEARSRFMARLAREHPDLVDRARPAQSNSTMMTVATENSEDEASVRELTEPGTRIYEDVQFEPF